MEIRKIKPSDKEEYKKIVNEFYHSDAVHAPVPDSHLDKTFAELLRSQERISCYLAEENGQLAAYALIAHFFSQEAGGSVVWLDEIFVRDAYRGKGIGNALIARIFDDCKSAAAFRLEIDPENEGAERLYKRLGFQKIPYEQRIKYNHNI